MMPTPSAPPRVWRYWVVVGFLTVCTIGLILRVIDLNILNRHFLQGQSNARTLRIMQIPAYRGMITDRNGKALAISTPVNSIWINPQQFVVTSSVEKRLARLLNMSLSDLRARYKKVDNNKAFVYLRRGIDPAIAEQIKALQIPGVFTQTEYRRFYPEGEVAAHLLGFTNVDDQGQEGLELAYNDWLRGIPGRKRVLKDRLGNVVAEIENLREPRPGNTLVLSLDQRIQYLAYRELKTGVEHFHAQSGSAVVLDAKTGEVLALVNQPSYNPNNRPTQHDSRYRNRTYTDTFEPGSTIKTFTMATALASGRFTPHTLIDTSPGWMIVEGKRVTDDEHNLGIIDLTTVLQRSSNVGMSKIALSLSPQSLWRTLNSLGFGQITASGFPGERPGFLPNHSVWHPFILATLSFGYGMTVTTMQLAQAYAVLANYGVKKPISLLRLPEQPQGEAVMQPKVSQDLLTMLESVSKRGGTAPLARIPGYRVAGKTGTAHRVGSTGYLKDRYNSIFVGIAPASHPRLVVAVVLFDPQGENYYGGYTAGPIFAKIMGGALRLLDIPPDDPLIPIKNA